MFEFAEKAIADLQDGVRYLYTEMQTVLEKLRSLDARVAALENAAPTSDPFLWVEKNRLMTLPTSGAAWDEVYKTAVALTGTADLSDNEAKHDVQTLAAALVAARTNDTVRIEQVKAAIDSVVRSPLSRVLELSRGLPSYIIAADLIGYRPQAFLDWINKVVNMPLQGHSGTGLIGTAVHSPTNWGNHARFALLLAGLYTNSQGWVGTAVTAFREFVGEPVADPQLVFTNTSWHVAQKMGIIGPGAYINGVAVSGVIPEDWRRGSSTFVWPPVETIYMWETLQGAVAFLHVAINNGLLTKDVGERAILRAVNMLYGEAEASLNTPRFVYPAEGDDCWIMPLVNHIFRTQFPTPMGTPGKGVGFTHWTHAS